MPGPIDLKDFVAGFLLEAEEHLHSVNRNMVAAADALKKGNPEPRAIRELFRSLHTIKGLSSMVGVEPIVEISHEMEGLLRAADRAGGRISGPVLDLIMQGTRAIEERVRGIAQNGIQGIAPPPSGLMEALSHAQGTNNSTRPERETRLEIPKELEKALNPSEREQVIQALKEGRRVLIAEFQPSPEKAANGINVTSVREALGKLGELVKVVPRSATGSPTGIAFGLLLVTDASNEVLTAIVQGREGCVREIGISVAPISPIPNDPMGNEAGQEWLPSEQSSIRVDVRRLDEALEQLSSLFVTRFKLQRVATDLGAGGADIRDLKRVIAENSRQLRRLRAAISEARMVPLTELLQRLPLVVRGITKDGDKAVNVSIQAGTAEVDKAVADKIFPAVVHIVRNAVDHALETREERKRAGKPETGELSVVCDDSSGTSLVLTVRDDGRGIDRAAVAKKADRSIARTDEELLQQICTAGLSTSDAVTQTSGRGMGMDIVKRTVELLGGSLSLQTAEGKGTSITIRVPVTVTIVDVLSFVAGGQVFVAPVAIVDEILELDAAFSVSLPSAGQDGPRPRLIQHRGKTIPLFTLDALLNGQASEFAARKALVVNQGRGAVAFGVERMLGKQEAVVRPLDDALVRVKGMSGATDLGDGRPTLVLDLSSLGTSLMENSVVRV